MRAEKFASRRTIMTIVAVVGALMICMFGIRLLPVQGQSKASVSYAAVPGEKGGQDAYGPYEVVADWPKPLSNLTGDPKWRWGVSQGIFAESPNRVFMINKGQIPELKRPAQQPVPQFGPSLAFPISGVPFRHGSQSPVAAVHGPDPSRDDPGWKGKMGVDCKWGNVLNVLDADGNVTESWTQWDDMLRDPHAIYISPYDPEKNVWLVDTNAQVIFKFSHDGKKLLQTIGTLYQSGADENHFNRPTFLAWLPDGTMYLADGYVNTRVVKFDKNGKFLMAWGQEGNPPNETRPNYFNSVHGIAVDPVTRRVFVNDRTNRRIQVFDENGKFLDQWSLGKEAEVYTIYMSADQHLWAADVRLSKISKFDLDGHFLYSWGSLGDWPGGMFYVHGLSVDQEGNLYTAEVGNARVQKFRPRKGANPDFLVGPPVRPVWQ